MVRSGIATLHLFAGGGRRITTEDNFRGVSLKWLVEERPDKFWPTNVECCTEEEINEQEEDMADTDCH